MNKKNFLKLIFVLGLFVIFTLYTFIPKFLSHENQLKNKKLTTEYKDNSRSNKLEKVKKFKTKKENNNNQNESEEENRVPDKILTENIKMDVKNKTNTFFMKYLENKDDVENRLTTIKNISQEKFFENIKLEFENNKNKIKKDKRYSKRKVNKVNITKIEAVNDGSILVYEDVNSSWFDDKGNHTTDESFNYKLQFTNTNGNWLITSF